MEECTGENPAASRLPSVSVLIPVRNADATIEAALDSVLSQDYAGAVEVIVADGSESTATSECIRRQYPVVNLISNPDRKHVPGLAAALRTATGRVIVRCDGHTFLPSGYLRRAVETLYRTGAGNVGGRQRPVGTTFFERLVAVAMVTPLGAGDARYRLGGPAGSVDTVYLGVFRRETLVAVGGYNTSLLGNEDYEVNWRLRQQGETVWFDPALVVDYRPRGTPRALARQYLNYGRMKGQVARQHPASLRARHLAAPLLVLGLAASGFLSLIGAPRAAAALPLVYLLVLTVGSLGVGIRRRSYTALLLPLVLPIMHLSWGLGFWSAVLAWVRRRKDGAPGQVHPSTLSQQGEDRTPRPGVSE